MRLVPGRRLAGPAEERDQVNRIRKAISSANRPTASTRAKPMMANGNTRCCTEGVRPTVAIRVAKMLPMPIPTPNSAITAKPAPIILAAARSIDTLPSRGAELRPVNYPATCPGAGEPTPSVHVDRVVEVEAGEDGEDVGLQEGDHELEAEQHHGDR